MVYGAWEADAPRTHKRSQEGAASSALRTLETTGSLFVCISQVSLFISRVQKKDY